MSRHWSIVAYMLINALIGLAAGAWIWILIRVWNYSEGGSGGIGC